MIDIGHYIKEVLKTDDSVIVQDLGSFMTKYKSAEIKSKTGQIAPPSKQIFFDEKQKTENGKLVAHIREKENIADIDIRSTIDRFVIESKRKLDAGEHVRINELGYLYKDKAYKTQFVQDTTENILMDTFGLQEIEWDMSVSGKKAIPNPVSVNEKKKSKILIIPISILILVILVLAILISHNLEKNEGKASLFGSLFSRQEKIENRETNSEILSPYQEEIDSLSDRKNALNFQEDIYSGYTKFYLVAGSFSIYNNAEVFKNKLVGQGYDAEVLEVDGKIFRVSIKSFTNRNEALHELERLQQMFQDRKLWILNSL